jgi:UDP-glucose 4-epimerase
MRCLVTGGAGVIGSRLCEELLLAGNIVIALDDLSTGRIENMLRLYQFSSFRFVKGSIRDTALFSTLMESCDEIYNLASVGMVKYMPTETEHSVRKNYLHQTQ